MELAEVLRRRQLPCCPRMVDCELLAMVFHIGRKRFLVLSKEWYDQSRSSVSQSTGCSTSTSVVDNSCDTTEQPFVGAVIEEENFVV
jgi:hypothetical protein